MKGNFVLVLSLLVVGIYGSSITNLVHTLSKSTNPTARFLSSFVQFHQDLPSSPATYKALFEALDLVRQYLEDARNKKNSDKLTQEGIHGSLVNDYNSQITSYTNELNDANGRLSNLNTRKSNLESKLSLLNVDLGNYRTQKTNLISDRNAAIAAFNEYQAGLVEAIAACDEALRILGDVQNSISGSSFLQTNVKAGKVFVDLLERKLLKSWEKTKKGDKLSFHMIKTLAQAVSKQSFNDAELVKKAISLVSQLRKRFQDDLDNARSSEERAAKQYETDLARVNSDIDFTNSEISAKSDELRGVEEEIPKVKQQIEDAQSKLSDAKNGLANEERKWSKYLEDHDAYLKQIEYELGVVADTVATLRDGGISESS